MSYLSDYEGSEAEDSMSVETSKGTDIKTCIDCGTSQTPLWRSGPAGPKSLCNACGIKSKRKSTDPLGVTKEKKKIKTSASRKNLGEQSSNNGDCVTNNNTIKPEDSIDQHPDQMKMKMKMKMEEGDHHPHEVEQAASILMDLSRAIFYA